MHGMEVNWVIAIIELFLSKAFLADDNLGDSLDGVEALIRKHEDFDKSFAAQAEKVNVSTIIQIILGFPWPD